MLHHGSASAKRTTIWSVRRIVVSSLAPTLEHHISNKTEISHKFQVLMGGQTFNLFSAPLPIARSKDKGPLKKVIKDKKTKVKTTRLKLGLSLFVGLGGLWHLQSYPLRPIQKKGWNYGLLRFQRLKKYTVPNLMDTQWYTWMPLLSWQSLLFIPCICKKLREYPKGLGKALVSLWRQHKLRETPMPCLRQKLDFGPFQSELDLFSKLQMGDTWSDAKLADCYVYLWKSKKLSIPKEWKDTMKQFTEELKMVPCIKTCFSSFCPFTFWPVLVRMAPI